MDSKLLKTNNLCFKNLNIEISIDNKKWLEDVPGLKALTVEVSHTVFRRIGKLKNNSPSVSVEVSFLFTNDQTIQNFNKNYRGQNNPTNVLSFPLENKKTLRGKLKSNPIEEGEVLLGDIILAFDVVTEEAKKQNKPLLHHISHLIIHGILHLMGYDHTLDGDAEGMEALEIEILEELGIINPYLLR